MMNKRALQMEAGLTGFNACKLYCLSPKKMSRDELYFLSLALKKTPKPHCLPFKSIFESAIIQMHYIHLLRMGDDFAQTFYQ